MFRTAYNSPKKYINVIKNCLVHLAEIGLLIPFLQITSHLLATKSSSHILQFRTRHISRPFRNANKFEFATWKLAFLTTNGAPSMIGNRFGFVSQLKSMQWEVKSPVELISRCCNHEVPQLSVQIGLHPWVIAQ